MMRPFAALLTTVCLALAACTPAAPPAPTAAPARPTTAPAKPTAAPATKPTEAPKPAAPATKPAATPTAATTAPAAKPAASPAAKPAATDDWQDEWDRVLAAARQEGTVAVIGPTGDERRASLIESFERAYGIRVEYLADTGAGVGPRLSSERGANQYLWDVYIGGGTTALRTLVPAQVLDPFEPALILPEVKDPSKWRGGFEFADPGRTVLVMTPFQRGTIVYNTTLVQADEITSHRDLLDPRYKGKIADDDPRRAGPGQDTFTFFYMHPDLGRAFIQGLAGQGLVMLRDYQQEIDAVGQGRFSFVLGTSDSLTETRQAQGVPIDIVPATQLKEGTDVNAASGNVAVFNRAPHPNAAKVYLNWLLSQEGQTEFARAGRYISKRLDVPTTFTFAWRIPRPGAILTNSRQGLDVREEMLAFVNEVFPS
jgi:iron(III) transport system substrate-binding protein